MTKLPWYKRDVDAWRGGTRSMSMELRGFYSECLDAMWDLQGPIPADEAKLAIMLCCNPRTIRKLVPKLIELGKLVRTADGYANPRMMSDMDQAIIAIEFDANSTPIRSEFDAKVPKNPMFSTRVLEIEEEEEKRASARGRSNSFWSKALGVQESDPGVRLDDGRIVLTGEVQSFWLEQFDGDENALSLALIRAAGYVQPASPTRLRQQVDSQLARVASDRRERQQRYEASKAEREARVPAQAKPKRTLADALRDYDARAA